MGESPSAGTAPAPIEITDYSVFEGLFRRALRVEPNSPLADALREVGFDLRAPKARYPTEVWRASLDVAARHRFPERSLPDAHRELGRLFTAGFYETIVGKVIGSIVPFLGMERLMARMPKFVSMTGSGMTMDVMRETERRWRMRYHTRLASAEFIAGSIEGGAEKTRLPVSLEIENRTDEAFDIVVLDLSEQG